MITVIYFKIIFLIIFKKKLPKKLFILKRQNVGYLIGFTYLVYIKILKKKEKNLKKRSEK